MPGPPGHVAAHPPTGCCQRRLHRRLAWLRGVSEPRSLLWSQPHGSPWGSATRQGSRPVAPEIQPALRDGRTDQPFDVSRRRLEKRVNDTSNRIELPPARTGRPASHPRRYAPDELVRFDARIPARLAKQLYDVALSDGRSVTAVHADLLAAALECRGAAMDGLGAGRHAARPTRTSSRIASASSELAAFIHLQAP